MWIASRDEDHKFQTRHDCILTNVGHVTVEYFKVQLDFSLAKEVREKLNKKFKMKHKKTYLVDNYKFG